MAFRLKGLQIVYIHITRTLILILFYPCDVRANLQRFLKEKECQHLYSHIKYPKNSIVNTIMVF